MKILEKLNHASIDLYVKHAEKVSWTLIYTLGYSSSAGVGNALGVNDLEKTFSEVFEQGFENHVPMGLP